MIHFVNTNDWKKAFEAVIPLRKQIKEKQNPAKTTENAPEKQPQEREEKHTEQQSADEAKATPFEQKVEKETLQEEKLDNMS